MAALTEINVDSDFRPAAAGTDTVKTIDGLIAYLSQGAATFSLTAPSAFFTDTVKASAGVLFSVYAVNTTASPLYIKFYNKASDPDPSDGDTPLFDPIQIPPRANSVDGQIHFKLDVPIAFSTGIGFVIVPSLTANNETALTAGDCYGHIVYV